MNDDLHNFTEDLKTLRMTTSEKTRLRGVLLAHASKTPVPLPSLYMPFLRHMRWYGALAFCFIVILTIPTTYAAERSLPGDALYALKVNVIEPTTELLAFDPESRARRITEHSHRRLEETVAVLDDKDAAEKISIAANELEDSTDRARKHLEESDDITLREQIDIRKDMLSIVEAHDAIVSDFGVTPSDATDEQRLILEDELIESVDVFTETASEGDVLNHIESSIEEVREKTEDPITEEQRSIFEEGIAQTLSELSQGDADDALLTLILHDQDAETIELILRATASTTASEDIVPESAPVEFE